MDDSRNTVEVSTVGGDNKVVHARRIKTLEDQEVKRKIKFSTVERDADEVQAIDNLRQASSGRRSRKGGKKMLGLKVSYPGTVKSIGGHRRNERGKLEFYVEEWNVGNSGPTWLEASMKETVANEALKNYVKETDLSEEDEDEGEEVQREL